MASTAQQDAIQQRGHLLSRLYKGTTVSLLVGTLNTLRWCSRLQQWFYPPATLPDITKAYDVRSWLSIRIFFPESYDQTSPESLPTIFSIHGGGFVIGQPEDDDVWNRHFANMHGSLVISLNYSKAPFSPYPIGLRDVEALMLAAFQDESLPIDKSRIAVAGFSAGGNLALGACQLPSIRESVKPRAVVALYPILDFSITPGEKVQRRYYKTTLSAGTRSQVTDYLIPAAPYFDWSYIPYEQNLRDPLLSPIFADRANLPAHVFIIGCELDMLGHEDWRLACRLAARPEPKPDQKVGQEQPAPSKGQLIQDDERFGFEHVDGEGVSSVRWLLIPDQIHGFDHVPPSMHGSEESIRDAQLKTEQCQGVIGEWLLSRVWA